MIVATAAKCRYCGEIFDPKLKKKKKKRRASSDADSELSTGEWVLCLLCSGIACIMGIIYMIQGKSKGVKMVGISIVMSVFWGIVRLVLEAIAMQHRH